MKILYYISIVLLSISCNGQNNSNNEIKFSISPIIDKTNGENKEVILLMEKFLQSKNNSITDNEYWIEKDFVKYKYPYADIYQIEKSKFGDNYYQPSLMELIDISNQEKLLKVAFIGVNPETDERLVKCIYNVIALKEKDTWMLKRAIDYQTKKWKNIKYESIMYKLREGKKANQIEMERQAKDIINLCAFFETEPIDITYYSCTSPKQVFEVKGFDYLPNMYFSKTGGMADFGNIVYSGNNSEYYTHEIVHLYTKKLFPNINNLLDEGIATYIGGSGGYTFEWHRKEFKKYLDSNKLDLANHLEPYERLYINYETSIPYLTGALICERVYRLNGKEKLFMLLNTGNNIWELLEEFGLTKENLTEELKKELKLPQQLSIRFADNLSRTKA